MVSQREFIKYARVVREKILGYNVYCFESGERFFMGEVYAEYRRDPESFEFLEPELMAFAILVGDNWRETLEKLKLDSL